MVVDQADALHERIDDGRADEAEASRPQCRRQGVGGGGRGGDVARPGGGGQSNRRSLPVRRDERGQGAALAAEALDGPRVADGRQDLGPVAHDARVGHEASHVALVEGGHERGIEAAEGGPEAVAPVQDERPAEAGLEALQGEALEQLPLVRDRHAPLLVVVLDHQRIGRFPRRPPAPARHVAHAGSVTAASPLPFDGDRPRRAHRPAAARQPRLPGRPQRPGRLGARRRGELHGRAAARLRPDRVRPGHGPRRCAADAARLPARPADRGAGRPLGPTAPDAPRRRGSSPPDGVHPAGLPARPAGHARGVSRDVPAQRAARGLHGRLDRVRADPRRADAHRRRVVDHRGGRQPGLHRGAGAGRRGRGRGRGGSDHRHRRPVVRHLRRPA